MKRLFILAAILGALALHHGHTQATTVQPNVTAVQRVQIMYRASVYWRDLCAEKLPEPCPLPTTHFETVHFHWTIAEAPAACQGYAGCAVWEGNDVWVCGECVGTQWWGTLVWLRGVMIHELGHTLGYFHGDPVCPMNELFCKPNDYFHSTSWP